MKFPNSLALLRHLIVDSYSKKLWEIDKPTKVLKAAFMTALMSTKLMPLSFNSYSQAKRTNQQAKYRVNEGHV